MLSLFLISTVILMIVCLLVAEPMSANTRFKFKLGLMLIMSGDVAIALCALYANFTQGSLAAMTLIVSGVTVWIYSDRRVWEKTHDSVIVK